MGREYDEAFNRLNPELQGRVRSQRIFMKSVLSRSPEALASTPRGLYGVTTRAHPQTMADYGFRDLSIEQAREAGHAAGRALTRI